MSVDQRPLADAVPGFDVAPRLFVLAPPNTPAPIVARSVIPAVPAIFAGAARNLDDSGVPPRRIAC